MLLLYRADSWEGKGGWNGEGQEGRGGWRKGGQVLKPCRTDGSGEGWQEPNSCSV